MSVEWQLFVAFNPNSGRSLDKSPTDPRLYIGKLKSPCVRHKTNLFRPLLPFTIYQQNVSLPADGIYMQVICNTSIIIRQLAYAIKLILTLSSRMHVRPPYMYIYKRPSAPKSRWWLDEKSWYEVDVLFGFDDGDCQCSLAACVTLKDLANW